MTMEEGEEDLPLAILKRRRQDERREDVLASRTRRQQRRFQRYQQALAEEREQDDDVPSMGLPTSTASAAATKDIFMPAPTTPKPMHRSSMSPASKKGLLSPSIFGGGGGDEREADKENAMAQYELELQRRQKLYEPTDASPSFAKKRRITTPISPHVSHGGDLARPSMETSSKARSAMQAFAYNQQKIEALNRLKRQSSTASHHPTSVLRLKGMLNALRSALEEDTSSDDEREEEEAEDSPTRDVNDVTMMCPSTQQVLLATSTVTQLHTWMRGLSTSVWTAALEDEKSRTALLTLLYRLPGTQEPTTDTKSADTERMQMTLFAFCHGICATLHHRQHKVPEDHLLHLVHYLKQEVELIFDAKRRDSRAEWTETQILGRIDAIVVLLSSLQSLILHLKDHPAAVIELIFASMLPPFSVHALPSLAVQSKVHEAATVVREASQQFLSMLFVYFEEHRTFILNEVTARALTGLATTPEGRRCQIPLADGGYVHHFSHLLFSLWQGMALTLITDHPPEAHHSEAAAYRQILKAQTEEAVDTLHVARKKNEHVASAMSTTSEWQKTARQIHQKVRQAMSVFLATLLQQIDPLSNKTTKQEGAELAREGAVEQARWLLQRCIDDGQQLSAMLAWPVAFVWLDCTVVYMMYVMMQDTAKATTRALACDVLLQVTRPALVAIDQHPAWLLMYQESISHRAEQETTKRAKETADAVHLLSSSSSHDVQPRAARACLLIEAIEREKTVQDWCFTEYDTLVQQEEEESSAKPSLNQRHDMVELWTMQFMQSTYQQRVSSTVLGTFFEGITKVKQPALLCKMLKALHDLFGHTQHMYVASRTYQAEVSKLVHHLLQFCDHANAFVRDASIEFLNTLSSRQTAATLFPFLLQKAKEEQSPHVQKRCLTLLVKQYALLDDVYKRAAVLNVLVQTALTHPKLKTFATALLQDVLDVGDEESDGQMSKVEYDAQALLTLVLVLGEDEAQKTLPLFHHVMEEASATRKAWKQHMLYLLFSLKTTPVTSEERLTSLRLLHLWSLVFPEDLAEHPDRLTDACLGTLPPTATPSYALQCTCLTLLLQVYRQSLPFFKPVPLPTSSLVHNLYRMAEIAPITMAKEALHIVRFLGQHATAWEATCSKWLQTRLATLPLSFEAKGLDQRREAQLSRSLLLLSYLAMKDDAVAKLEEICFTLALDPFTTITMRGAAVDAFCRLLILYQGHQRTSALSGRMQTLSDALFKTNVHLYSAEARLQLIQLLHRHIKAASAETRKTALNQTSQATVETNKAIALITQVILPTMVQFASQSMDAQLQHPLLLFMQEALAQSIVHPLPYIDKILAFSIAGEAQCVTPLAEHLYATLAQKYPSFIHNKDVEGIHLAFKHKLASSAVKATRGVSEKDGLVISALAPLVATICGSKASSARLTNQAKKQWESLVTHLLQDDTAAFNANPMEHLLFLRFRLDALVALPFKQMAPLLFLLTHLQQILTIEAPDAITAMQTQIAESASRERHQVWLNGLRLCMLQHTRTYLQKRYSVSDQRCEEYLENKTPLKEERGPLLSKKGNHATIDWSPLPLDEAINSHRNSATKIPHPSFKVLLTNLQSAIYNTNEEATSDREDAEETESQEDDDTTED